MLVLDLPLPDRSWIETIRWLRARLPDTEIIVVTMEASAALAKWGVAARALGFVLKERAYTDLPAAIRLADRRESFLSLPLNERIEIARGPRPAGIMKVSS